MKQKHSIKRREFLAGASVAGAACVIGVSSSANQKNPLFGSGAVEVGSEFEVFEKLVGDRFTVVCEETGNSTTLVLTDVKVRTPIQGEKRPKHVRQQSCSLLFASRERVELENAIRQFDHPQLGSFQLYIDQTRWDQQPNWTHYDAVIG